jgi:hypothetical protein
MSILMEVGILLYFMQMIISQVGLIGSALLSYQQQKSSIFSGARGVAAEGQNIMNAAITLVSGGFKSAKSELLKGGKFAYRTASDVTKFAKEHDGLARKIGINRIIKHGPSFNILRGKKNGA